MTTKEQYQAALEDTKTLKSSKMIYPANLKEYLDYHGSTIEAALTATCRYQKLVEALEFYAASWVNNSYGSADGNPSKRLLADKGQRASKALAEHKGGK